MTDALSSPAPATSWKEPAPGTVAAISVVIVNWNSKDYLRDCLRSLKQHAPSVSLEVIVVDGGSFDGCDQLLAREFPVVKFIQSPDNIGFARSNNLGAKSATGEFLLLLNPDTQWIDDSLEVLWRQSALIPTGGAIGCRLLNRDHTLQTSCVQCFPTAINQALDSEFLRRLSPRSALWGMAPIYSTTDQPVGAEAISGACILVKRAYFSAVGGFTESYFMYGEDLDLCFKLTRAGHPSFYVPNARVVHYGGGSSGQTASNFSTVMMRSSVHHFMRLHRGAVSALAYRISIFLSALARLVLIFPMLLFGKRVVSHGAGSLRKWTSLLRWSLGLSPEVKKPSIPAGPPQAVARESSEERA